MYQPYGLLIDNQWHPASDGTTRTVSSAATEEAVGTVPSATVEDIESALASAQRGFLHWKQVPAWERAAVLRKAADLIRERAGQIAGIIAAETGKPTAEGHGEALAAADQFEWYSEEAKRIYGQIIPARTPRERLSVVYQPVGVCVALSAWNFPVLLPARKIAAALGAGCSVIARPASEAPGASLMLGQALIDAGLPAGALSILTGGAEFISSTLIASDIVRKVSLTGSVPVGKRILGLAAKGVKKVSMELGGHAPVIVHRDADPETVAATAAAAKFRNCGQVCISPSRFYVHEDIRAPFETAFADYADTLVIGDGRNLGVSMGPMIRASARDQALDLIEDAVALGAERLAGGNKAAQFNAGHFLEPTVLGSVPDNARIMFEEPFAPIAPISGFTDFDEVIARANGTPFGLASYVFTNDAGLAERTSMALEAGMVGINKMLLATAEAPFGGVKESGFGREGGSQGILDYLDVKYIRHAF